MALTFTVRRRDPELIGPASPTPRETRRLSYIDGLEGFRVQAVPCVFFYRCPPRTHAPPAGVIRRALAEALVPYYPLAGRLREVEERKLVVDCTGEGVMFVEADADVRLAELELAGLTLPFPCADQLLFDVEGSGGLFNCPLLLIQVTRLLCGGFVLALRLNHTICDAIGLVQFLSAVAELARGLPSPTVSPAWSRELLVARVPHTPPPLPHHDHPETAPSPPSPPPGGGGGDMVMRTFTFTPADVGAIRRGLPPGLRDTATTFDVLASALWRARTAALELPPDEDARLVFVASVRGVPGLGLPAGYYGNACVPVPVVATVESLLAAAALGGTVELVRAAKAAAATAEYVRSVAGGVLRRRTYMAMASNVFVVSDSRRAGFRGVDFGWGAPVYGGPATAAFGTSFLVAVRNSDGEDTAAALPIVLPRPAMERFASEVERLLNG
ncbi:unnamed protein product [Urochloa humidicola]